MLSQNRRSMRSGFRFAMAFLGGVLLLATTFVVLHHDVAVVSADPIPPGEGGYPKFNTSVKAVTPTLTYVDDQMVTYTIAVVNTGAYTAAGTTVADVLPAAVTYGGGAESNVPGAFSYDDVAGVLTWEGDVGFDATAFLTFSVSLPDSYSGTLMNMAVISHPLISQPFTMTAETIVTDVPLLAIEKTSAPERPGPGNPITYTLTVANWGQPASNLALTVTDYVPLSTTLRSMGSGAVSATVGGATVVTWTRQLSLGLGESTSFVFSVDASDSTVSGTVITNDDYWVAANQGVATASGEPYTVTLVDPILRLSKEIWPDPPGSNREMTYTLTVHNIGSLATDLVITDRVPAGITYVRGGSYQTSTRVVSWTLPELDTDEFAEVAFTAYISDVMDVAVVNSDYSVCSAEGICQPGKVLTNVVDGPNFVVDAWVDPIAKKPGGGGGPVTPTLVIHNIGPGNALDAQAMLYFDRISVSGTDLQVIPDEGTVVDGPNCGDKCVSFVWTGDLLYGDTITFTTRVGQSTIGGEEETPYTATVVITDNLSGLETEPVTGTAFGLVTHFANLVLTKRAPRVVGAGQMMTYTINVRNGALATNGDVVLTDVVPMSTTFVRASHGGMTRTISDTVVVSWTLPQLGPGDQVARQFAVHVDDGLISGTEIYNSDYAVQYTPMHTDAVPYGMPVTTTVQEVGLIHSFKTVTPLVSLPGDDVVLTYYLHIVNSSPISLTDVTVYDLMPWESSTYQRDAVASTGSVLGEDIISFHWVGDVDPLSTEIVTMTVRVDPGYQGMLTNTAVISHADLREEVIVEAVAYVTEQPVLRISKSATPSKVEYGDELAYTIRVVNLGQPATQLVISDTIPGGTTYVPDSATGHGELAGDAVVWEFLGLDTESAREVSFRVVVEDGWEVVNDQYGVWCDEGIVAWGPPVTTEIAGTNIYLPLVLKKG